MIEKNTERTARYDEEAEKRPDRREIEDLDVREEDGEDVKGGGGKGGIDPGVDPSDGPRP